jgi:hypothetical protein
MVARVERLPAATAAERLADAAGRVDSALPDRGHVATLLAPVPAPLQAPPEPSGADAAYPFLSEAWLRGELRKLVDEFGAGMAEKQVADQAGLLDDALILLAEVGLVTRTTGGVLVLPLLARYRSVTAQIKEPARK